MDTVLQKKPFTIFCRVNPRSSYLRVLSKLIVLSKQNILKVLKETKYFSEFIFQWFDFNYMKISSEKGHIFFSGNINANIGNDIIISENKNNVLGAILESKLSLVDHINNVCR